MLRALGAGHKGWKRPRLCGNEFVGLLRLRHLALESLDCPHGGPLRPCMRRCMSIRIRAPLLSSTLAAQATAASVVLGARCRFCPVHDARA